MNAFQKRRQEGVPTEHEDSVRQQILEGLIADKGGDQQISTATRILAEVIASDAAWLVVFNGAIDHIIQNNPARRPNPLMRIRIQLIKNDWQLAGLGALQNLVDISGSPLERRVIPLPLLLLWHHGGVVAGNEPLRTIPAIRIAIAATDYCACLGERKCVEASINGGVAADLYEAQINLSGGAIL
jgi:hypothetical protein